VTLASISLKSPSASDLLTCIALVEDAARIKAIEIFRKIMQKTSIALILAASSTSAMQVNKSDADGLFKLMDANVTRGNLKNLVTDKPSPITVGLA
jgi:ABC-type transport system involved in Fe-S cluster assembly fused permease/ATPase subunit